MKRSSHYEKVKYDLTERVAKVGEWHTKLDETCEYAVGKIQAFQREYGGKLTNYHQNLAENAQLAILDIDQLMLYPDYRPLSAITRNCWRFINDEKCAFIPDVEMETDPERVLQGLRDNVEQLVQRLKDPINIGKEDDIVIDLRGKLTAADAKAQDFLKRLQAMEIANKKEVEKLDRQRAAEVNELREKLAAASEKITPGLTQELIDDRTKEQQNTMIYDRELEGVKAEVHELRAQRRAVRSLLNRHDQTWPKFQETVPWNEVWCCILWPLIGLYHNPHFEAEEWEKAEMFLLPLLSGCIGAAINRTRIGLRHGVNSSFLKNLLLYSTVVCIPFLLVQEKELIEQHKAEVVIIES